MFVGRCSIPSVVIAKLTLTDYFVDMVVTPKIPVPHERLLIAAICIVAAVRVFIFSAAFPFFNNVDEQFHFDLVYKYSRGHLPLAPMEKFDPQASKIIGDNISPEYFYDLRSTPTLGDANSIASMYTGIDNRETWSWPTYYILAGLWCRLGNAVGLGGGYLLYWIRFLNVPIAAALVWLSYLLSRKYLSGNLQRISVPLLVAFFPHDIFFAITADVLSPLVFAAAFFMLLEIYLSEKSWRYHLLTGLIIAAALLTKASNIAIAALAGVVILVKLKRALSQKSIKRYLPSMVVFAFACAIPVVLWLGRNYILFGDIVGSAAAAKELTWTRKPPAEMFNHPIFTPRGLFAFLAELTKRFWRGEFFWGETREDLAWAPMDWFYCISSWLFLLGSFAGIVIKKPKMYPDKSGYRSALAASFFVCALSVLLLAAVSLMYDFGRCINPSRAFPFFVSGRLIVGTILPFLLLYVDGLHRILTRLQLGSYLLIVVGVIATAVTLSEIVLSLPAFASPYNWFHI
jgi:hypothetical protein